VKLLVVLEPGCCTQGETVEESLDRACDAIKTYLTEETPESLLAAGVDLRPPHVVFEVKKRTDR